MNLSTIEIKKKVKKEKMIERLFSFSPSFSLSPHFLSFERLSVIFNLSEHVWLIYHLHTRDIYLRMFEER